VFLKLILASFQVSQALQDMGTRFMIAPNRNTTEGMNNIIYGLNLQPGDEVVLAKQDYPNVINSFKVLEKRNGIVLKWVNLELPMENEDDIAEAYISAFTGKTKLVSVTHIINGIGQIIPVKKIAAAAHQRGIEVLVDGAHSFALLDFKIPDLDCDYFATCPRNGAGRKTSFGGTC
jgi:selenocysteine lyase/cysteine desulfurase